MKHLFRLFVASLFAVLPLVSCEKAANVKEAFAIRDERILQDAIESIRKDGGRPGHILLVDDVFTTGSTVLACFTALRAAFPSSVRISIATLGFVGDV